MPSEPASIPTPMKRTNVGIPKRAEVLLVKILANKRMEPISKIFSGVKVIEKMNAVPL